MHVASIIERIRSEGLVTESGEFLGAELLDGLSFYLVLEFEPWSVNPRFLQERGPLRERRIGMITGALEDSSFGFRLTTNIPIHEEPVLHFMEDNEHPSQWAAHVTDGTGKRQLEYVLELRLYRGTELIYSSVAKDVPAVHEHNLKVRPRP